MEKESFKKEEKSEQQILADQFEAGEITPQDFIDKVSGLDQRTNERDDAENNLSILKQAESKFTADSELGDEYYNLFSLTCFHLGQQEALKEDADFSQVADFFAQALSAAEKAVELTAAEKEKSQAEQWQIYCQATASYFNQDSIGLENAYNKLESGQNREVVNRLLNGLNENKSVDYNRDY